MKELSLQYGFKIVDRPQRNGRSQSNRIVRDRTRPNIIRLHFSSELAAEIGIRDSERVVFGTGRSQPPGYLGIGRAVDYGLRGNKCRISTSGAIVSVTSHPLLVQHLFPGDNLYFVPAMANVLTTGEGLKVLAFEWPGYCEYVEARNALSTGIHSITAATQPKSCEVASGDGLDSKGTDACGENEVYPTL